MLISWLKSAMRRRPAQSVRRRSRRRTGGMAHAAGQLESLEERFCLSATVVSLGADIDLVGVGVQDDGDSVLVGNRFNAETGFTQGVIFEVAADGSVNESVVGTFGGDTFLSGVSTDGVYVSGSSAASALDPLQGFRATVAASQVLTGVGALGDGNASLAFDVSAAGVVVGTTDGGAIPFSWESSTGLVGLSGPVGGTAFAVSSDGTIVGSIFSSGDRDAVVWRTDSQELLEEPEGFNSQAIDVSPNGTHIGGLVSFEDLVLFETVEQAAVWVNGELNRLETSDGAVFEGTVRAVSNNGYAVGESSNGQGFIWHESFAGVRMFDEWLLTEHGETLPTAVTSVEGVVFDGTDLHFAANGSACFIEASLTAAQDSPTHRGTDGADDLTIDVTGLDRVMIETGAGNDRVTLVGTPEAGVVINIDTGDGNDIVRVHTTAAVIAHLGDGHDRFYGNAASIEPVTVFAGAGNDRIFGGAGDDLLNGGEGNDRIHGRDGNDTIDGGNGRNRLFGHRGNDHLIGGAQRDVAMGGSGDDVIDLGAGNDVANGGSGNDILLGRAGNDRLRSGSGNDSLFGGAGRDRLFSSQGSSYLSGGDANDRIHSFGTDRIDGGADADSIRIFKAGTQVVTDETDTIRGPAATSSQLVAREENTALVDAAFASLLALDSGYELPLL